VEIAASGRMSEVQQVSVRQGEIRRAAVANLLLDALFPFI